MCRQDRLTREARGFGAAIDAVAKAHQLTVTHETTQHAQHLILAAEIAELARQEYVVAPFGDPRFHTFPQCRLPAHESSSTKTRHSLYAKTRQYQGNFKYLN